MVPDDIRFVVPVISAMRLSVLISFSVSMFAFGVISIEVWETQFPVWGFVLALCIGVFIWFLLVIFTGIDVPVLSMHIHYTHWRDPGHNEPASWAKRHHRADHWIRPPRPPDCDDAVQDVGLYHHDAGTSVYQRLQTRALYEGPASSDVLVSNRCDGRCCHCATRSSSLDVL